MPDSAIKTAVQLLDQIEELDFQSNPLHSPEHTQRREQLMRQLCATLPSRHPGEAASEWSALVSRLEQLAARTHQLALQAGHHRQNLSHEIGALEAGRRHLRAFSALPVADGAVLDRLV